MAGLAVVAFENLSSDANLNWGGRAAAATLVYDLAPTAELHAQMAEGISGALATSASEMLEGYYSERNGRVEMAATLEDLERTTTIASYELSGPAAEGLLPLLNQLAKRISPTARRFGTSNPEAFRAYGEALNGTDPATLLRGVESATAADPHFAIAYLTWARLLLAQGKRDEALRLLKEARAASPDAIDATEIDYLAASTKGDADGRAKALAELTRLTPSEARWPKELADLRFVQRRFQEAAEKYEAAARLAPDDANIWNQLGYAYAYSQDLTNARRAIEHYSEMLGSENSNALDSLGEVSFFLGDFSGAERYFIQAQEKNGARRGEELVKAAQARLMAGDLGGADVIFQRYVRLAEGSRRVASGLEQTQWEFLTGRRKSGMARLEQMISSLGGDQQAVAMCQLSIWELETGSADAAAELARKAEEAAQSQRARNVSALCRIIADMHGSRSGSPMGDAYALVFAKKYAEALPLLEAMYRETNPTSDGQIRTILAWANVETNHVAEAGKLVQIYPIPLSSGDPLFASLMFPRFLHLRGVALAGEGKQAEAKKSQDLFIRYSGDVPDIFGGQSRGSSVALPRI